MAPSYLKMGEKLRFVYLLQAGERNFSTLNSHNLGRALKCSPVLSCALKDQQDMYSYSSWYYTEHLFLTNEYLPFILTISNSVPGYF